jgi:hypothetical protein
MSEENDVFSVGTPIGGAELGLLRGLVNDYCQLDEERSKLEDLAADAKAKRDEIAKKVLALMGQHDLKSQKFNDGLQVIAMERQHTSIPPENRAQFHKWLKANGYWDLARVNAKQEEALLRERLENEQPIPDYIRIFKEPALQLRGRKKGGN